MNYSNLLATFAANTNFYRPWIVYENRVAEEKVVLSEAGIFEESES